MKRELKELFDACRNQGKVPANALIPYDWFKALAAECDRRDVPRFSEAAIFDGVCLSPSLNCLLIEFSPEGHAS